jgi:hypothetical protein
MNPLRVPQQGPYGDRYLSTWHFALSLKNLINISLNKKALRKKHPFMFNKSRPLEADVHF